MHTPGHYGADVTTTGLAPLPVAARRLGRCDRTLKRWHSKNLLPVVILEGRWYVPASFIDAVEASPQPGRAGRLEEIARDWFAANSPAVVAS